MNFNEPDVKRRLAYDQKPHYPYPQRNHLCEAQKLYEKFLANGLNPVTLEASKSPAKESSDKANAARHEPLVYKVEEIARILAISSRAAYNLCNSTTDFKVIRIGKSIRVNKQSFDNWLASA